MSRLQKARKRDYSGRQKPSADGFHRVEKVRVFCKSLVRLLFLVLGIEGNATSDFAIGVDTRRVDFYGSHLIAVGKTESNG